MRTVRFRSRHALALPLLLSACVGAEPTVTGTFRATGRPGDVTMPAMIVPASTGEPFDLRAMTEGRVTLLFVGYTYCPDVCPVHMSNLAAVLNDFGPETAREIRTIFVTADPERDTPERLQEWMAAIEPDFHALRPSLDTLYMLEDSLGLPRSGFTREPGQTDYLVGHAAQVVGFDRNGVARAVWPWGTRQRDWRADIPRILDGEWPDAADTEISSTADAAGGSD